MNLQHFNQWLVAIDKEQLEAIVDRKVWCIILLILAGIILIASYAPIASDFFAMSPKMPFVSLSFVAICAFLVSSSKHNTTTPPPSYGVLMLITSAVFQTFMWTLVCASHLPGAALLAALPVLLAAYHGEFFQLSPKYPWACTTTLSALLVASLLSPSSDHTAIIIIGGVIALGAAFTMGNHAQLKVDALKDREALRAAIDAQTLLDSVQEVEQAKNIIHEIRGTNHDAGNALSGILMNLDLLSDTVARSDLGPDDLDEIRDMATDLSESTHRLRQLIETGRDTGKQEQAKEIVNAFDIANATIIEAQKSHPNVNISLNESSESSAYRTLHLHGGQLSLHRILLNLLINACEGDGSQGASRISLDLHQDNTNSRFTVKDNGPGIPNEILTINLSQIKTTKQKGSGLGLYTSKRLIIANHGSISFNNDPTGGAHVTVTFPRDKSV